MAFETLAGALSDCKRAIVERRPYGLTARP